MRFVTDLSKGILGQADSVELWSEIISYIPDSVLLKPGVRILNVACGHGTEVVLIAKRMLALGISKEAVNDASYLIDKYNVFTNHAKAKYGFKNVITADFLTWKTDMKFDVVIGNPPYLKRGWKKFLEKMVDLSIDVVASINPDPTNNNSKFGSEVRALLIANGIYQITNCTTQFPAISSGNISYFLCCKTKSYNFSFYKGTLIESIVKKICSKSGAFVLRGSQKSLTVNTNDTYTENFSIPGIFGIGNNGINLKYIATNDFKVSKKYKINLTGPFFVVNRFYGKNNPDPVGFIPDITNHFIGYNVLIIKANLNETIEGFNSVYGSTLYRCVIGYIRQGGFDITQSGFASLQRVDLTRTWTNAELYAHFDLTQEEIDYIEKNVK